MLNPDDEQFEDYLKRFHPVALEPVPTLSTGHSFQRSRRLEIGLAVATVLVVLGLAMLHVRSRRNVASSPASDAAVAERRTPPPGPLTMRSANAWLSAAPSFKAALDDLTFRAEARSLPQGKQSAVAALSKEKIRL